MHREIRVLLVDDNVLARKVGRKIIEAAGLNAVWDVSSGQEALDTLRRSRQTIDVVFCDVMMPGMDGVQFARHASALPAPPAIVFVSGADAAVLGAVETTAKARNLRILGTIKKPLTVDATRHVLKVFNDPALTASRDVRVDTGVTAKEFEAAMADGQLLLHFQPKILIADGALGGVESLVRWHHPQRGMVLPGAFIAVAEANALIGAMTIRTMTLALAQMAAWAAVGRHLKVSVNLSAYMLVDIDLPDRLAREAAEFGIDPQQLILEITETGVFADIANSLEILTRLRMKGFPLSIDDFGTGYSSMRQLSQIPFTEMKIDRAFVHHAAENPTAKAILEASVNLGRTLGMSVVAEGVETKEDWDLLRKVGVDLVQGYFVAKPMAAEYVQPWIAAWDARQRKV